jgi:hypothetical protein
MLRSDPRGYDVGLFSRSIPKGLKSTSPGLSRGAGSYPGSTGARPVYPERVVSGSRFLHFQPMPSGQIQARNFLVGSIVFLRVLAPQRLCVDYHSVPFCSNCPAKMSLPDNNVALRQSFPIVSGTSFVISSRPGTLFEPTRESGRSVSSLVLPALLRSAVSNVESRCPPPPHLRQLAVR